MERQFSFEPDAPEEVDKPKKNNQEGIILPAPTYASPSPRLNAQQYSNNERMSIDDDDHLPVDVIPSKVSNSPRYYSSSNFNDNKQEKQPLEKDVPGDSRPVYGDDASGIELLSAEEREQQEHEQQRNQEDPPPKYRGRSNWYGPSSWTCCDGWSLMWWSGSFGGWGDYGECCNQCCAGIGEGCGSCCEACGQMADCGACLECCLACCACFEAC
ncbi:hypothetical protein BT63DRAFT_429234 [Microthyrium microscopicum]|uniref:Uncharacterized protein n=1 Tax=Microthyrium microscopicum TaxID=703497 RepID=A0A6A6U0K8_9PEZI|nr:hypothetical protein BT63DRAFT_429234 [Microthyrium microscopicum]